MADRAAILDLFADYAWANDAKDADTLKSAFTADATFTITIAGVDDAIGPFEGRDAIFDFIYGSVTSQTDQRRHVIVNHRVLDEAEGRARVRAYLSLHVIDGGVLNVTSSGVYDTQVVLDGGAWRFAAMDLALDAPF